MANQLLLIDPASLEKYRTSVRELIFKRLRIVVIVAIIMFIGFNYTEKLIYPSYPNALFFKFRLLLCSFFILTIFVTSNLRFRKYVIWWNDAVFFFSASAMCAMVYFADGASGNYYEGLFALLWAVFITNSYYPKHNIFVGGSIIIFYALAARFSLNTAGWNPSNYAYALRRII